MMKRIPGEQIVRIDLLITVLGLLGLALVLAFYDQAFPSAAIDLELSRDEIAAHARAYLEGQGYDLTGYHFALTFDEASWSSVYVQRTVGIAETNRLAREERLPLWLWQARWFKPLQKEEFNLSMTPAGRVVAYSHSLPEDTPGAQLTPDEAHALAVRYLHDDRGWPLDDWQPVSSSAVDRPGGRTDRYFSWKRRSWDIGKSELRLNVTVHGSRVDGYSYWIKVPETFERGFQEQQNRAGFVARICASLGFYGFGGMALLAYLLAQRKGRLPLVAGVVPGLVVAVVGLLAALNRLPLAKSWYSTTQGYATFWADQVMNSLLSAAFVAVNVAILWAGGRQLARVAWPRQDKLLSRDGDRWQQLARSTWRGLMLGGIWGGYAVVFYLAATHFFGSWVPLDTPYTSLYATPLPFLAALAAGVYPAVTEEFLFRLIGIGLFLKLTRNRFVALLIPGAVWGFAHMNYVRDPIYLRGIELTISAVLLSGLIFLWFDLTTVIVAHFAYNAGLVALPLLRSGEPNFVVSGLVVVTVMLAPVVPGVVRVVQRRLRGEGGGRPQPQVTPAMASDVASLSALPIEGLDWEALVDDPDAVVLCLRVGVEVLGVAAGAVGTGNQGEVLAVYVAPAWQRRYWGSVLVDELSAALRQRGMEAVQATVATGDRIAAGFWASLGWQQATTVFSQSLVPSQVAGWRPAVTRLWALLAQQRG